MNEATQNSQQSARHHETIMYNVTSGIYGFKQMNEYTIITVLTHY